MQPENMSCELPQCDFLNVMRIKRELDFVTCWSIEATLMVADTSSFRFNPKNVCNLGQETAFLKSSHF